VIAVDLMEPAPAAWKTIVAEQKESLETVGLIGGRIVGQYLVDVQSRLRLYGLDGTPHGEVTLPGVGTVSGLAGREDSPTVWFAYSSPLAPMTIFPRRRSRAVDRVRCASAARIRAATRQSRASRRRRTAQGASS
jgi:prolyl oligopeptidase